MKCTIIILYNFLGFPVHMSTIVSKSLFVVIRLQFSSTKTFFPKIRKSHKITKQHRIKGQKILPDRFKLCLYENSPRFHQVVAYKRFKIKLAQGSMPPNSPSLPHLLHSDTYWSPLGKKLKEALT